MLEYASPVWQIADAKLLDEVQRKALSLCLDSYGSSGREALEVELGVTPLSIRQQNYLSEKVQRSLVSLTKSSSRKVGKTGNRTLTMKSSYHPLVTFSCN